MLLGEENEYNNKINKFIIWIIQDLRILKINNCSKQFKSYSEIIKVDVTKKINNNEKNINKIILVTNQTEETIMVI